MIQRRDRGQQPLIGNAFEPSLVVLSGLLPDSVVHALHFLLVGIGYGFPLLQQGSETLRHSLLRLGDACLQGSPERFLKAFQKGFLLGIDLLPKLDPFLSCGALQLVVVSAKFLPGSALDFINECGGRGIGRFGEKGTGAFERVARHVVHLRLCVVEVAAAGMIELRGKHARDFSRFVPLLACGLLDGFFRIILNLRLGLLFVPFRGLMEFVHHLMFQVADFSFQFCQRVARDGLRRFAQDLLDAAEVFAEVRQGLGERFIGGSADAVLLQRQRCVGQRAAARKTLNRLLGARNVRLHDFLSLLFELPHRIVSGLFEG